MTTYRLPWKVFNPDAGIAQEPPRAHSLGWLEHPADNREVTGSNPVGPTTLFLAPDWVMRDSAATPSILLLVAQ